MSSIKDDNVPHQHRVYRVGDWLPGDHRVQKDWTAGVIKHVDNNPQKELHPVLKEFGEKIESDTRLYMLFQSMFEEVPTKKPYNDDPTGHPQIRDYQHMLQLLNHLMTTAPIWNDASENVGMVGVPINAILDWPMGTPSGYAVFLEPEVNKYIKKILDAWGEFLMSEDSIHPALSDDKVGWFSEHGKNNLEMTANKAAGTSQKFDELFHCEPTKPFHGYTSWDNFFTRTFRFEDGVRPVASPDDDNVIANSCESKPYAYQYDCKMRDRFWIKGQPYSVLDMLAHDELAPKFDGCSVYQAFLSALSYHRWHSPVSGKIVKSYVVPGTYYSEPLFEGIGDPTRSSNDIDMGGETTSQGYLSAVATRAIMFIEADNPAIGLMAFLGIGMTEVSTCEMTVKEGQHVKKGEQLGMFHFGGSTHCLMFRKGVNVQGFPEPGTEHNIPVRSKLAVVKSS